jgi:hypothetical protein
VLLKLPPLVVVVEALVVAEVVVPPSFLLRMSLEGNPL